MSVIEPGRLVVVFNDDPAARILEFGMAGSGLFGPHPAQIVIEPRPHLRVALQLAFPKMRSNFVLTYNSTIRPQRLQKRNLLQLVRQGVIKVSSTLGDLGAIGINSSVLNRVRGGLLTFGRSLGDVNAVQRGLITQRVMRRAAGRYSARSINAFVPAGTGAFGRRVVRKTASRPIGSLLNRI
jgi:hypothetical protein